MNLAELNKYVYLSRHNLDKHFESPFLFPNLKKAKLSLFLSLLLKFPFSLDTSFSSSRHFCILLLKSIFTLQINKNPFAV